MNGPKLNLPIKRENYKENYSFWKIYYCHIQLRFQLDSSSVKRLSKHILQFDQGKLTAASGPQRNMKEKRKKIEQYKIARFEELTESRGPKK